MTIGGYPFVCSRENIQDHLMIYAIVGNSKSMDMEKLSKFGQIVKVTKKDIYR
jgi:hypothetical protein